MDIGLNVGDPGYPKYKDRRFHHNMNKARRIYPHVHNMDGFFICKMIKVQKGPRNPELVKEVKTRLS